jgi:uncharacterized protein YbcI
MADANPTIALEVAQAARRFQEQRTGHAPTAVTVVLSEGTLVITLHGALTPAERALSRSPAGAAQVQEYHRQLFVNSSAALRQEITRITGVNVREAAAEVETATGTVVHAFTSGTMVQVFLLAEPATQAPSGGRAAGPREASAEPQGPQDPELGGGPP